MVYPHSELLFPHHCLSALEELRTSHWQGLVKRVNALPEDHEDSLSLCLVIIELCGCLDCDLNSYKASLGCRACAKRTLGSFKGTDAVLERRFEQARTRIRAVLAGEAVSLIAEE